MCIVYIFGVLMAILHCKTDMVIYQVNYDIWEKRTLVMTDFSVYVTIYTLLIYITWVEAPHSSAY